jgi:hypothetical protein
LFSNISNSVRLLLCHSLVPFKVAQQIASVQECDATEAYHRKDTVTNIDFFRQISITRGKF